MAQKKVTKPKKEEVKAEEKTEAKAEDEAKPSVDDIDGILDEIDGVLEEDAQTFVDQYVQKGGEASTLKKRFSDMLRTWTLTPGIAPRVALA